MQNDNISKEERLILSNQSYSKIKFDWGLELSKKGINNHIVNRGCYILHQAYFCEAIYQYYIEHDIKKAKESFYTIGRVIEYAISKFDANYLDHGLYIFFYVLLSDDKDLIIRFANLKHRYYDSSVKKGHSVAYIALLQCIIRDDWTEYERILPIVKTKTVPKNKMEIDLEFCEALVAKDKNKMEKILSEMVSPKMNKNRGKDDVLYNEFFSHIGLGYSKLAWFKGIEVNINSPLIPFDLLPIRPLENYEDRNDFLL